MKKTWLAASAAVFMLGMAVTAFAQADRVTIAVSVPTADHGWTGGVLYDAKQEAALLEKAYPGLTVIVKPSPGPADQANALEDLTATQKIDALVVLPYNSDQLTEPVRRVKEKGVLVTVVDRGLKDSSIQDVYVAGNNPEMGRVSGEYMLKKLGGKGDIVVLRGIPTVIDTERVDAFKHAIAGSQIKILDMQFANWNRDDGFKVMQDFLSKYNHIDAVWAQDDDIAIGVLRAISQAKRTDIKFVLGGGGMKEMVKRVMDQDKMVPADVLYPPSMIKTAMAVTAAHYYGDAPIEGTYIVGSPLITPQNAKQYYDPNSPF
jgi:ribose transport system substrate-binding protein